MAPAAAPYSRCALCHPSPDTSTVTATGPSVTPSPSIPLPSASYQAILHTDTYYPTKREDSALDYGESMSPGRSLVG